MHEEESPSSEDLHQQPTLSEKEKKQVDNYLNRTPTPLELTFFSLLWATEISLKNSIRWLNVPSKQRKKSALFSSSKSLIEVKIDEDHSAVFSINSQRVEEGNIATFFPKMLAANVYPIANFQHWQLPDFRTNTSKDFIKKIAEKRVNTAISLISDFKIKTIETLDFYKNKQDEPLLFNLNVGIFKKSKNASINAVETGDIVLLIDANSFKNSGQNNADSPIDFNILKTDAVSHIQFIGKMGFTITAAHFCTYFKKGLWLNFAESDERTVENWLFSKSKNHFFIIVNAAAKTDFYETLTESQIPFSEIGEITENPAIQIFANDQKLLDIPTKGDLQKAAENRPFSKPAYLRKIPGLSLKKINSPKDLVRAAKQLFLAPNQVSKQWIFSKEEKSASKTRACAETLPLNDAKKLLLIASVDNPLQFYTDPFGAAMIAVTTAVRRIICSGGTPLSVLSALNFGDLNDAEVYWQFLQTTKGIEEACAALNIHLAGGEVAGFAKKEGEKATDFLPRPIIHAVGKLDNADDQIPSGFQEMGDQIYMLGNAQNDLAGSEYLRTVHKTPFSKSPYFDLHEATELNRHLHQLIQKNIPTSINDVGQGGLFMSLMQSAMEQDLGFTIETVETYRRDAFLFGESQNRVVITVAPDKEDELQNYLISKNVAFAKLGEVFGNEIVIDNKNYGELAKWKERRLNYLKEKVMGEQSPPPTPKGEYIQVIE